MDLSLPISAVVPTLDGPVLGVLVRAGKPLTGRKVHQMAATGSESGTRKVLNRLVGTGLVIATEVGASIQYSLNRDHLAAGAVIELTELRQELIRRMQERIEGWSVRPLHVGLFDTADGVELLVVHDDADSSPTWAGQLDSLADRFQVWTGNHLRLTDLSAHDLQEHLAIGDPSITTWLRAGEQLSGQPFRALLNTLTSNLGAH
ncbi:hypothetical protein [Kribbella ginsengisoli]|uniref:hypothetical protein n=1 Tax=Kribbella ginsengisoli TaxID=363865 RepID=UPI0031CDB4D8